MCIRHQNLDGVNYFHVKVVGLLFVATTRNNLSPSLALELLQRIARVIKDYLGVLNEESLRKNFVLVYELLDEVVVSTVQKATFSQCTLHVILLAWYVLFYLQDFGYVQTTSTEVLKSFIFNEPIVVDAARMPPLGPASLFMVLSSLHNNQYIDLKNHFFSILYSYAILFISTEFISNDLLL